MLSLAYPNYHPPIYVSDEDGSVSWWLPMGDDPNSGLSLSREFNWTVKADVLAGKDLGGERVTFSFDLDGKVKPSGRTLRRFGSKAVSSALKRIYAGGDPKAGYASYWRDNFYSNQA